ncbi:histidine phosphatase family protein [Flavimaricola marinus]|uniref:Histidine phosphatase superfamily (Branch 1) n=1 Tax=Flavimaricola marinus TaxID=1819565 RepID=A0A238LFT8_9RHOB|nr:histidine phosphatase family protein [Flavimaricola marinus]SMY07816.1 Histidine phosphatase superfamily (branch 1) [Flavimaricola marinus]
MRLVYVSHPEVVIDPDVLVPDWHLSDLGRRRTEALAARGWPGSGLRIVSSPETKAMQTAGILAAGAPVELDARTSEVDRTATGYLPHEAHEAQADALFARPEQSTRGWERAIDAQARMVAALADLVADGRDVMMVGHGGVGTLLWCHVSGRAIARSEDQSRGGCVWQARLADGTWHLAHEWRVFEDV